MAKRPVTVESVYNRQPVEVDPWSPNPLLDDLKQADPKTHAAAAGGSTPPAMFKAGDLPPFIASGIDPSHLLHLPYGVRHAAAAEPSAVKVLGWIEEYGNDPHAHVPSPDLTAYLERMRSWAQAAEDPDDAFNRYFSTPQEATE